MILYCSSFKFYPEYARQKKAEGEYHKHTINCDKYNARKGDESKLNKKTSTSKPLKANNDTTCKVRLLIDIDLSSFFLVCGLGKDVHEGHRPLDTTEPTWQCTVPKDATTAAKQMATKGTQPGLISGVLNDIYGIELSKQQVAQTTQMAKLAKDLIGADYLETNKDNMSDLDRKKTNIYFMLPLCSPRITENSQPTRLAHKSVRGHVVFFLNRLEITSNRRTPSSARFFAFEMLSVNKPWYVLSQFWIEFVE
jgi:hypothetical protein